MEKVSLTGYVEFAARLKQYKLSKDFSELLQAADRTQIHTFGWPVGVVLYNEKRPRPYSQDGIRLIYENTEDKLFEYWTLDRNGDYYVLSSLFEDMRKPNSIFLDTRTIRAAETFLRTARLYMELGVPDTEVMDCRIEHGKLKGRVLTAANPLRAISIYERECSLDQVVSEFSEPIKDYLKPDKLKEIVFEVVKSVTEVCDMFVPSKAQVTDPMVDAYLQGKII